jgi:hypothetical protein
MEQRDGLFLRSSGGDTAYLLGMIRGELAIAAHLHAANLYPVGPFGS